MLYDQFTDYPYADTRVYRTREEAEKRAERMTGIDEDGIDYWATVHPVMACWKEEE
jgi:hypothetical protein